MVGGDLFCPVGALGADEEEEEDQTSAEDEVEPSELASELWPASPSAADMSLLFNSCA